MRADADNGAACYCRRGSDARPRDCKNALRQCAVYLGNLQIDTSISGGTLYMITENTLTSTPAGKSISRLILPYLSSRTGYNDGGGVEASDSAGTVDCGV